MTRRCGTGTRAKRRFDGHKAAVAVDTDEGFVTAVAGLAGNAPDLEQALELVQQSEMDAGCAVDAAVGVRRTATAGPARRLPRPDAGSSPKCRR
jgi:hypothetical protein